jgi:hypothetical protein
VVKKKSGEKFVIRGSNGTYFECWTGIGPCFGATKENAMRFDTEQEARLETCKHSFAFFGSRIEEA